MQSSFIFSTKFSLLIAPWCFFFEKHTAPVPDDQNVMIPISGLQVRRVHISTTDKDTIDSGLWLSSDSEISTLLWQDPNQTSWAPGTSYRYNICFYAALRDSFNFL